MLPWFQKFWTSTIFLVRDGHLHYRFVPECNAQEIHTCQFFRLFFLSVIVCWGRIFVSSLLTKLRPLIFLQNKWDSYMWRCRTLVSHAWRHRCWHHAFLRGKKSARSIVKRGHSQEKDILPFLVVQPCLLKQLVSTVWWDILPSSEDVCLAVSSFQEEGS